MANFEMNNEESMEFLDFTIEPTAPFAKPVYFYNLDKVAPDVSNLDSTHSCEDRVTFAALRNIVLESMEVYGHTPQHSMLDSIYNFSSEQPANDHILNTDQLQLLRPQTSSQERQDEVVILHPINDFRNPRSAEALIFKTDHLELSQAWQQETVILDAMHSFSNQQPAEALIFETDHLELSQEWHQEMVILDAIHSLSNQQPADALIFRTDQLQLSQERQQKMITLNGIHNFSNQQPAEAVIFNSDQLQPSHDGQQETVMESDANKSKHKDEIVTMIASDYVVEMYNPESTVNGKLNCGPFEGQIEHTNPVCFNQSKRNRQGKPKSWTQDDMNSAMDALRTSNISLPKASLTFGIPTTTLYEQTKKIGIDVRRKRYSWSEGNIDLALNALRTQNMSLNKASLTFGIPITTLSQRAQKVGIRVAKKRTPKNIDYSLHLELDASRKDQISSNSAAKTDLMPKEKWSEKNIDSALNALRTQNMTLNKASITFGIPNSTLSLRAQKMGIHVPKKRSRRKLCTDDSLHLELAASRKDQISSNKAAKIDVMPQEKLNTIPNEEETQSASSFCDAFSKWIQDDLEDIRTDIRTSVSSVSSFDSMPTEICQLPSQYQQSLDSSNYAQSLCFQNSKKTSNTITPGS